MTPDELQATIDRAEDQRQGERPEIKQSARVLTALPRAAAIDKQQIELGLDGNSR